MQPIEWAFAEMVSTVALVVAIFSAYFSWRAVKQAKRQADAITGDVPPTFSAFQTFSEPMVSFAKVRFEVVNGNRCALMLRAIKLEHPQDVILYNESVRLDELVAGRKARSTSRLYEFENPVRIRGKSADMVADSYVMDLTCQWLDDPPHAPARCGFVFHYDVDGERERKMAWASAELVSPAAPHLQSPDDR